MYSEQRNSRLKNWPNTTEKIDEWHLQNIRKDCSFIAKDCHSDVLINVSECAPTKGSCLSGSISILWKIEKDNLRHTKMPSHNWGNRDHGVWKNILGNNRAVF